MDPINDPLNRENDPKGDPKGDPISEGKKEILTTMFKGCVIVIAVHQGNTTRFQ
jgi:hypothetical protein